MARVRHSSRGRTKCTNTIPLEVFLGACRKRGNLMCIKWAGLLMFHAVQRLLTPLYFRLHLPATTLMIEKTFHLTHACSIISLFTGPINVPMHTPLLMPLLSLLSYLLCLFTSSLCTTLKVQYFSDRLSGKKWG